METVKPQQYQSTGVKIGERNPDEISLIRQDRGKKLEVSQDRLNELKGW